MFNHTLGSKAVNFKRIHCDTLKLTRIVVIALLLLTHKNVWSVEGTHVTNKSDFPLKFSEIFWDIKEYETIQWGPGRNYFSSDPDHIWVDNDGALHLSISERNGKWYSTEVISQQPVGYGTYTFTIEGDLKKLPGNVTLGLFTWNERSFQEAGNSELDIEISKWGNEIETQLISYAVQPIGSDPIYEERVRRIEVNDSILLNGTSTHVIIWKPNQIDWRSYRGTEKVKRNLIAEWKFSDDNPGRSKVENNTRSNVFVIPEPGNNTHARINFWVQEGSFHGPIGGLRQEVKIKSFKFEPSH
ncbi:MAG: hypothetical protein KTR18_08445 [Acidiferrobacterales bacterium]|nr:hypothetical protein [Acidiferrobacterales bacterium]